MKHLLSGVAIAAALAIAGPVWAQNAPMTPGAAGAPAAAAPAKAPAAPKAAAKQRHHRATRHMAMHGGHMAMHGGKMAHHGGKMGAGEAATEQLNREELQRLQSGNTMPPPGGAMEQPQAMGNPAMPGPRPSGGGNFPSGPAMQSGAPSVGSPAQVGGPRPSGGSR